MYVIIEKWGEYLIPWLQVHGLRILLILLVAYVAHFIIRKFIVKTVKLSVATDKYSSQEASAKREETLIRIFSGAVRIIILLMAALMIIQEAGVQIGPILAGAGILGIAVGFGGQYLIRDIIAGFFIILENQYRIGDVVKFDAVGGLVEDISLRMTTLRDLDGVVHHIQHGEIRVVSNLSKGFSRVNLEIGVAYDSNIDKVIEVVNKTGMLMSEDPEWKETIIKPIQFLRVNEFGDSAIIIKILGETQTHKQWEVGGEFRKRLKVAFDKEGITIPFPQRVVHNG